MYYAKDADWVPNEGMTYRSVSRVEKNNRLCGIFVRIVWEACVQLLRLETPHIELMIFFSFLFQFGKYVRGRIVAFEQRPRTPRSTDTIVRFIITLIWVS